MARLGSPNCKTVQEVVEYIDKHFGNTPFSLKEVEDLRIQNKIMKFLSRDDNRPNAVSMNFLIISKSTCGKKFQLKKRCG